MRNFKLYPDELLGRQLAIVSGIACGVIILAASVTHYYIYLTEVPEGYRRVEFASLKSGYGEPDVPPPEALALDGQRVFLKGYIFPSSVSSNTFKTFVLVPDFATCCFGKQPPMTHMIHVNLTGDLSARYAFRRFKLAGTLKVDPNVRPMADVGGVYYTLAADYIR